MNGSNTLKKTIESNDSVDESMRWRGEDVGECMEFIEIKEIP